MAQHLVDSQAAPATPAAGKVYLFPHLSTKQFATKDENGRVLTLGGIQNQNIVDEVANAADTYLAGSKLAVPSHLLQARTTFRWRFGWTKTAAGLAAPVWNVRVGAAGAVGDTSRLLFTSAFLQTAVVDAGWLELTAILRNIGVAGVLAGILTMRHNLQITGMATVPTPTIQVTSAAFDTTPAGLFIGVSVNPGAAGVWTHQVIDAEMVGI